MATTCQSYSLVASGGDGCLRLRAAKMQQHRVTHKMEYVEGVPLAWSRARIQRGRVRNVNQECEEQVGGNQEREG
eukprot:1252984-Pyramimonas_sp.AAC.1